MAWVKLDDQFPDHPKVVEAGPTAAWLYICGLSYSARYLTDGFIPSGQVRRLADIRSADAVAVQLERVGLWESVDGGYLIHDYHLYQPSADQVKREREEAKERMGRRRSQEVPPNDDGSSPEVIQNNPRSSASPSPSYSRPEKLSLSANAPRESARARKPKTRLTVVDDDYREQLEDEFGGAFGSREAVRDTVDAALSHKAVSKYCDQRAYVRNWLRKDAEQRTRASPARASPNGRPISALTGKPISDATNAYTEQARREHEQRQAKGAAP